MVTVLYRPNSEHARLVDEFKRELDKEALQVRLMDVDSREGTAIAQLYDILQFPSVIATREDGTLNQSWIGQLPLIKEVGYFAHR